VALTLATVEAAIEGLMGGGQSFSVDGVAYYQVQFAGLIELRKQLKREGGTGASAAHAFGYRIAVQKPPEH
jgi:hypothetical protein